MAGSFRGSQGVARQKAAQVRGCGGARGHESPGFRQMIRSIFLEHFEESGRVEERSGTRRGRRRPRPYRFDLRLASPCGAFRPGEIVRRGLAVRPSPRL